MENSESKFGEDEEGLTILGALAQLKADIFKLQRKNLEENTEPLFLIEGGEIELKLVAKKDVKAEAKGLTKFKLVLAGGEAGGSIGGSSSHEHFQTIKIKFSALMPTKKDTSSDVSPESSTLTSPTHFSSTILPRVTSKWSVSPIVDWTDVFVQNIKLPQVEIWPKGSLFIHKDYCEP